MNFPPLGVAKRFITYTSKAAHSTHFNRSTFCSFIYMYIYIYTHTYTYKHIFKFLHDLSLHSFSSLFLFLPISLYFPRSAVYIFLPKSLSSTSRTVVVRSAGCKEKGRTREKDRQRIKKQSTRGQGVRERRWRKERVYTLEYLVSGRLIPVACFVKDVSHGLTYFIGFLTRFASSINSLTLCPRLLAFRLWLSLRGSVKGTN